MSNKEWDLNNNQHLQELVHALIMNNLQWKTGDEHKEHRKSWEILQSYTKQYSLKKQLKEVIDTPPFKIGDRVITKDKTYCYTEGTITSFHANGKHMTLDITDWHFIINDFELVTNNDDTTITKSFKKKEDDHCKQEDISWDTSFERCKRLEKALQATVNFFVDRVTDSEHWKQWDEQRTSINGIPCIYPKETK
jgi:hypothetical protein